MHFNTFPVFVELIEINDRYLLLTFNILHRYIDRNYNNVHTQCIPGVREAASSNTPICRNDAAWPEFCLTSSRDGPSSRAFEPKPTHPMMVVLCPHCSHTHYLSAQFDHIVYLAGFNKPNNLSATLSANLFIKSIMFTIRFHFGPRRESLLNGQLNDFCFAAHAGPIHITAPYHRRYCSEREIKCNFTSVL